SGKPHVRTLGGLFVRTLRPFDPLSPEERDCRGRWPDLPVWGGHRMPRLIPFSECVARPPEGEQTFPLADHLRDAGELLALRCPDPGLVPLFRLAGLCHDIYKAHPDWQAYVLSRGAIRRGAAHAAAGAFLFSWLAYRWL